MTTLVMEPKKVNVLIFPTGSQYAADCLELNVCATEPTKEEAAKSIRELVVEHLLTGLAQGIPFNKLCHPPTSAHQTAYAQAGSFSYPSSLPLEAESLPPNLQEIVREIEYRFYPDAL